MKKIFYKLLVVLLFGFISQESTAQLTIVNANVTPFNISPNGLCQLTIMNPSSQVTAVVEAQLRNAANNQLIKVVTTPVILKKGITSLRPYQYSFQSVVYSGSNQANYLKTHNKLPSGNYQYCARISVVNNSEDIDDYCQEIDATDQSFLYLVFPEDKEEIETKNPILMWMHSEPFNVLSQGEFFRMVVVELGGHQGPEAGIISNPPCYLKNYLSRHQAQYPFDAKALEPGKRYGWQVQKISNGTVVATTEAWEFTMAKEDEPIDHRYVSLKRKLDGGAYPIQNDRLFFRFDERYTGNQLRVNIYNEQMVLIQPSVKNQDLENAINAKEQGYNRYELDLLPYKLKKGYYLLVVKNEKQQQYKLKFYVN